LAAAIKRHNIIGQHFDVILDGCEPVGVLGEAVACVGKFLWRCFEIILRIP
jgi:hypothetical protein